jgi:hypothetical protein
MRKKLDSHEFFARFDLAFELEQRKVAARLASDKLIGEIGVANIGANINLAVIALTPDISFLTEWYRSLIESDDFLRALPPELAELVTEYGQARDSFFRVVSLAHHDTIGRQAALHTLHPDSCDIVSFKDSAPNKPGRNMRSVSGTVLDLSMTNLEPGEISHLQIPHGGWISPNRTAFAKVVRVVDKPDGTKVLEPTVDIEFID